MKTKAEIVKNINTLYNNSEYAIFIDYKGMNAVDTSAFRCDLRTKCNVGFYVVKNTLNKIGAKDTQFSKDIVLKGQCGVVFCNDILQVSKIVNKFCYIDKKAVFVGCFNKCEVCSEEQIKEFASLPSMEEIRTKLLYILNSVGSSFARCLDEKV